MESLILFIILYVLITGVTEVTINADSYDMWSSSTNETLTRAILGFMLGFIIIPIRFMIGMYEIFRKK